MHSLVLPVKEARLRKAGTIRRETNGAQSDIIFHYMLKVLFLAFCLKGKVFMIYTLKE